MADTLERDTMRIGSLFTGAGGLDMAVHSLFPDATTAWFSEVDPHAAACFQAHHPDVPNLGDMTTVDWNAVEPVDVMHGGFPCQDISHAGKGAGIKEGTRSGLWYRMADAISILRPRLVLLENVAAILANGGPAGERWRTVAVCPEQPPAQHAGEDPAALLGTPRVTTSAMSVSHEAVARGETKSRLENKVAMLPTPTPNMLRNEAESVDEWKERRARVKAEIGNGNGFGVPLTKAVQMLPTPRASDGPHGGPNQTGDGLQPAVRRLPTPTAGATKSARNSTANRTKTPPTGIHPGNTLTDAVDPSLSVEWGDYADAIARWEHTIGRPAPAPTDDKGRLSPAFVEWMMGWPDGWTAKAGASRSQRLKMCGNGVVPLQATAAYLQLLDRSLAQPALNVGWVAVGDDDLAPEMPSVWDRYDLDDDISDDEWEAAAAIGQDCQTDREWFEKAFARLIADRLDRQA